MGAEALQNVHADVWKKASAECGRLTDTALARWSNCELAAAQQQDEQSVVTRARWATALEVRITDLLQRAESAGYVDIDDAMRRYAPAPSVAARPIPQELEAAKLLYMNEGVRDPNGMDGEVGTAPLAEEARRLMTDILVDQVLAGTKSEVERK